MVRPEVTLPALSAEAAPALHCNRNLAMERRRATSKNRVPLLQVFLSEFL